MKLLVVLGMPMTDTEGVSALVAQRLGTTPKAFSDLKTFARSRSRESSTKLLECIDSGGLPNALLVDPVLRGSLASSEGETAVLRQYPCDAEGVQAAALWAEAVTVIHLDAPPEWIDERSLVRTGQKASDVHPGFYGRLDARLEALAEFDLSNVTLLRLDGTLSPSDLADRILEVVST